MGRPRNNGTVRPDLIDSVFGRLTVKSCYYKSSPSKDRPNKRIAYALCECECGNTKEIRVTGLTYSKTLSCGCLQREAITKHGMSYTSVYGVWGSMVSRCTNPHHDEWDSYGGRGITVCDRWLKFENFYEDMGDRPSDKHSLDRLDNDKSYSNDNCEWRLPRDQMNNRRNTVKLTHNGITKPASEWADESWVKANGINHELIISRKYLGWDDIKTLETPVMSSYQIALANIRDETGKFISSQLS
jgi:hypothetical protein